MAYDEGLAERIRMALSETPDVTEKKMFGGLSFLVAGNMACGVLDRLIVRVGKEKYADALARPHVREMDFTGRSMRGWVYVEPDGYESDADLQAWVKEGVQFAQSLPPK